MTSGAVPNIITEEAKVHPHIAA
jgi:hypothetical protein